MSFERDTARIVRSWLQVDQHESADRVLDTVLGLLDTTPQRRPWWRARRVADMNAVLKVGIAAAAMVVVALAGVAIFNRDSGPGITLSPPPESSPAPAPASTSPSPSISPRPEPTSDPAAAFVPAGPVTIGRHTASQNGIRFSFDIATNGWTGSGIAVQPDGETLTLGTPGTRTAAWILIWSIDGVYADPCGGLPAPVAGPTAADLAADVAGIPGIQLEEGPTDVIVGGQPAKYVALTIPGDIPCPATRFRLWYDDVSCDGDDPCYRWPSALRETHRVWIVQTPQGRVWIEAETYNQSTEPTVAMVRAIIDSIQFE